MALTAHQPRISEGTRTARTLNQSLTPDPYLLAVGNDLDEYITKQRARPPLRLIKRTESSKLRVDTGPLCGFGSCSLSPECTNGCRYTKAAHELADFKANANAAEAAANKTRRITWILLTAWCIGWLLLVIGWAAFA